VRKPARPRVRQPEDLLGQVLEGKYRVCGIIGQGGMGTVYEAEHVAIGRRVALKVLRPEQVQKKEAVSRFEQEVRAVSLVRHPAICQIYDVGQLEDGSPFMVMERLKGESLADRLERSGKIEARELVPIVIEALGGLEAAHRQGIIHRDLKPDNIFVGGDGQRREVKVLDFGISKMTGLEDAAGRLTRTGMVMGTPYYMAPEQAMGERNLDRRVDVWGAGVVLYEALTGQRPFVAKNYNALLVQILTSAPKKIEELLPGVHPRLAEIVRRALEKKRETRFQSAGELRQALLELPWTIPLADAPEKGTLRSPSSRPAPTGGGARVVARGTMIGAGTSGGRRARLAEPPTEETLARDDGDEEPTMVLMRHSDDDVTAHDDPERTEVDPPRFLNESTEGSTTERRRR
jgi:serine/threonine-protein kinase